MLLQYRFLLIFNNKYAKYNSVFKYISLLDS